MHCPPTPLALAPKVLLPVRTTARHCGRKANLCSQTDDKFCRPTLMPCPLQVLLRVLNARQFGLKMIANVSYGYTAAGFSGRLPFAELADSIVQSGRQTLENAIALVRGLRVAQAGLGAELCLQR